jgi:hypothetical protein
MNRVVSPSANVRSGRLPAVALDDDVVAIEVQQVERVGFAAHPCDVAVPASTTMAERPATS